MECRTLKIGETKQKFTSINWLSTWEKNKQKKTHSRRWKLHVLEQGFHTVKQRIYGSTSPNWIKWKVVVG